MMIAGNTELHNQSATSLAHGLRKGHWTSVALTEHFLKRIREINPQIHAVPYVFEREALAQARESDARRAAGSVLSEIDGLPMTILDLPRLLPGADDCFRNARAYLPHRCRPRSNAGWSTNPWAEIFRSMAYSGSHGV